MEGETKVKYFKQCMWIATCVTVRNKTVIQDLEKAKAILQVMEWNCLHLDEQLQEEFTDSYSAQEDKSFTGRQQSITVRDYTIYETQKSHSQGLT